MAISEKKYQKLFEEAQADAIRFRQERDAALGAIRMIGRLTEDPRIVEACKAAIAGKELPNDDTARIDGLEAFVNRQGALVIHTGEADCGEHCGLGLRPGHLRRTLREALDQMLARSNELVSRPKDTVRLDAVIQECADIELTCGGVWRVTGVDDYEDPDLRTAIDKLIAGSASAPADDEPEPECECRYIDVDQVDARDCPAHGKGGAR